MKSFFKLCFVNSFVRGTKKKKTFKEAVQVIIFHHLTCHYSTIDLGAKWFHNYKAGVRVANLNFYFPSSVGTQFMNGTYFFIFTNSFFFSDKDIDCDIRENIINYEDEGGGEGDQTGYDLSVLRMMSDGTPALHAGQMGHDKIPYSPYDAPDIQTFLQTNKVQF